MIYFVDEDVPYAREYSIPLRLRGYDIEYIPNADLAIQILECATDIELVIMDIMLATADADESKFGAYETDNFLKTGLLVIDWLIDKRPGVFPRKFSVLTAATGVTLVSEIKSMCKRHKIKYFPKSDFPRPTELADKIEKQIIKRK